MEILFPEVNGSLCVAFYSIDLTACTHNDNVSIPNLAELLFERCTNSSWVVVFKAECTFHHLMSYGNEVRMKKLIIVSPSKLFSRCEYNLPPVQRYFGGKIVT